MKIDSNLIEYLYYIKILNYLLKESKSAIRKKVHWYLKIKNYIFKIEGGKIWMLK